MALAEIIFIKNIIVRQQMDEIFPYRYFKGTILKQVECYQPRIKEIIHIYCWQEIIFSNVKMNHHHSYVIDTPLDSFMSDISGIDGIDRYLIFCVIRV